jgi:GT2 family glycosyltransferase
MIEPGEFGDVGVVVLAFGEEPLLADCLAAVLASEGVLPRLVVVDNGFSTADEGTLRADPRITWLTPGRNLGFTGGCNLGAAALDTPVVVFVNSDAVVAPGAIAALAAELVDPGVGLVSGQIVLLAQPGTINSVGNPVHYSLISWAGGWGDPVGSHPISAEVASATGAMFAIRTRDWRSLGGFHEALFAYGEDVELSLRTWQSGRTVRYVPGAVAAHHYEFSRNPAKFYLLERNRLINLLTLYETRTLRLLLPALLVIEAGVTAAAIAGGWFPQKLQGWRWLWANRSLVARRRTFVQESRLVPDSDIVGVLADAVTPAEGAGVSVPPLANRALAGYGRWLRTRLRREIR